MTARTPQEDDVLPARRVLLVGALGIVITLLVVGASALLLGRERVLRPAGGPAVEESLFDAADRATRLTARKRQLLDSAGWVDREHKVAHIPIQDAMDLVVERSQP